MTEPKYKHTVYKTASVIDVKTGEEHSMEQFRQINPEYAVALEKGNSAFKAAIMGKRNGVQEMESK